MFISLAELYKSFVGNLVENMMKIVSENECQFYDLVQTKEFWKIFLHFGNLGECSFKNVKVERAARLLSEHKTFFISVTDP